MANYLETIIEGYRVMEQLKCIKQAVEDIPKRDNDADFNGLRKIAIEALNTLIKQGKDTINN